MLTGEGPKARGIAIVKEMFDMIFRESVPYTNVFKDTFHSLSRIDPSSMAHFIFTLERAQRFLSFYTELKNKFDILCTRLNTSGRNEHGTILDTTAEDFCKTGMGTVATSHQLSSNLLSFLCHHLSFLCQ